ncbi:type 1 glutamine amidotransferase [Amycolatopsis sp. K13G38]|uniref:Type 1 glutamine amidotransferase n=1 Tax=Amycolatopsis acididurans TaxID=2724524 RepID=A0ABX1JI56_9PSEU|nr:type 1 glutamine amidotransferase [Amycolatopsis acididurans]NKQ59316.1 type 1 glutamine amidotransferase [Amycolatopsis acididurans]
MSTPRLLVIQPDETDPPATLGDWLTDAGAQLDIRRAWTVEIPDNLDGYQGLVCLGGGMNAEEDDTHPWLADIRRLLASAAHGGTPVLGVCLGAQLLASATGGRVTKADKGPEVGGYLIAKKDAAWTDPLFAELPLMPDVFHFHADVITSLPPSAVLLASSPKYPNQAYRLGGCAYGIQFHIETTVEIAQAWAHDSPEMAETAKPGTFDAANLTELHADLAETWRPFAARFVQLAAGDLQPATPPPNRTLPLA